MKLLCSIIPRAIFISSLYPISLLPLLPLGLLNAVATNAVCLYVHIANSNDSDIESMFNNFFIDISKKRIEP